MEAEVTLGNIHDSAAFDAFFRCLIEHSPKVQAVTTDAGYKTPWICKQIFDSGRACPALQTTDDKEREPAMARICLRRIQGFSISEIDPIAGTMTFTNAGENCNLSCAFMPRYKEKLAVLSTEQGAKTLALRFHLDSALLLVSKETESPSFNGEMKHAVESMKKMATDMERLGGTLKALSLSRCQLRPDARLCLPAPGRIPFP